MNLKKIRQSRQRKKMRVRSKLQTHTLCSRISVFRSHKNISVQLIDDVAQKTIASSSSLSLGLDNKQEKMDKKAIARAVGLDLAAKAKKANIAKACFDRGSYLYHGRVKALADGIREGGIEI